MKKPEKHKSLIVEGRYANKRLDEWEAYHDNVVEALTAELRIYKESASRLRAGVIKLKWGQKAADTYIERFGENIESEGQ